jgi:transcription initiation factor IIE alpha subunit
MSDAKSLIHFQCPKCAHHLETKEKNKGRQFQCPKCDHVVHVPSLGEKTESGKTWDDYLPNLSETTTKRKKKEAE